MLDISVRNNDRDKAYVYMDGSDARLFKVLKDRLGSDERAQNALILEGLIYKLKISGNRTKAIKVQKLFPEMVGLTYLELQRIVSSID